MAHLRSYIFKHYHHVTYWWSEFEDWGCVSFPKPRVHLLTLLVFAGHRCLAGSLLSEAAAENLGL